MELAQSLKQPSSKKYASRKEQETSLRDGLQEIASKMLVNAGFIVHSRKNSILDNKLRVSYERNKAEDVAELNGGIEGEIKGTSFYLSNMTFSYRIQSYMNYFAGSPETHSFRMSTNGTRVTKQQLKNAFKYYVTKAVLGHKEFFDELEREEE